MTDEERRNRNPAPEFLPYNPAEHPEMRVSDLEQYKVYILEGNSIVASMNYMGQVPAFNLVTLQPVVAYLFDAPRAGIEVTLLATPEGTLVDTEGHKITLRKFTGPDA